MPRRNYYNAVIFNLDGVILDTERIRCDAWKRAGGVLGFPISEPLACTLIGMTRADSENMLTGIYGSRFPFPLVYDRMIAFMKAYADNWGVGVQPGVYAVLDMLDRLQSPRAAVTIARTKAARTLLLDAPLLDRFDALITLDDIYTDAPLSALYLTAAQRLKIASGRCLAFESCDAGVLAAHAAGATVILVPHLQPVLPFIMPYVSQIEPSLEDVVEKLPSLLAVAQPETGIEKKAVKKTPIRSH